MKMGNYMKHNSYWGGYTYINEKFVVKPSFRGYGKLHALGLLDKYYGCLGAYIRIRCKYPLWDRFGVWHPINWIFRMK